MISIKNFVNTQIDILNGATSFSGFRTTIYFIGAGTLKGDDSRPFRILNSSSEIDTHLELSGLSGAIKKSIETYFDNGGTRLCVVRPETFTLKGFKADLYEVAKSVDDYFFVTVSDGALSENAQNGYTPTELVRICNFGSGVGWSDVDRKTLNKIRICLTASTTDYVLEKDIKNTLTAVKYSTYRITDLVDAALLIGAYFSKVDVEAAGAIKDYHFTPELLGNSLFENIDQATFDLLINDKTNGYYNFIGKVSNRILNIGGDYCRPTEDLSISLDFGTACIERDLDFATIELLFGKLALTAEGQSKLIDSIKNQLNTYIDNGFLEQDASYSGETVKTTYNGKRYTVIEKGDILPLGYKVFYVPINAISATDKANKKFPYIYVAFQSVHGARVIQINGGIV